MGINLHYMWFLPVPAYHNGKHLQSQQLYHILPDHTILSFDHSWIIYLPDIVLPFSYCHRQTHKQSQHLTLRADKTTIYRISPDRIQDCPLIQDHEENKSSEYPMLTPFSEQPAPALHTYQRCRYNNVWLHPPSLPQHPAHRIYQSHLLQKESSLTLHMSS